MKINALNADTCWPNDLGRGADKDVTSAFFGVRGLFDAKRQK
jgi:hypothetical protein